MEGQALLALLVGPVDEGAGVLVASGDVTGAGDGLAGGVRVAVLRAGHGHSPPAVPAALRRNRDVARDIGDQADEVLPSIDPMGET